LRGSWISKVEPCPRCYERGSASSISLMSGSPCPPSHPPSLQLAGRRDLLFYSVCQRPAGVGLCGGWGVWEEGRERDCVLARVCNAEKRAPRAPLPPRCSLLVFLALVPCSLVLACGGSPACQCPWGAPPCCLPLRQRCPWSLQQQPGPGAPPSPACASSSAAPHAPGPSTPPSACRRGSG
jgi:hypothetical protein